MKRRHLQLVKEKEKYTFHYNWKCLHPIETRLKKVVGREGWDDSIIFTFLRSGLVIGERACSQGISNLKENIHFKVKHNQRCHVLDEVVFKRSGLALHQ